MADRARPTGVLILVIAYLILGVIRFGEALIVTIQAGTGSAVMTFCLAPTIILGIIYLVVAIGLYSMARWAWILALIFAVIGVAYAAIKLFGLGLAMGFADDIEVSSAFIAIPIISLALNLIVMLILFKNREYFD